VNFADFERSIASTDLKAIAQHWNSARGKNLIPRWTDIRPAAIARQLPIVWCYFYDPDQNEFIGRLGGEAITRVFGRSIKGAKLSELAPIIGPDNLALRLKRVLREPALFSAFGPMFAQGEQYGVGEQIIMPLASDGIVGDAVIGATDYKMRRYLPSDLDQVMEKAHWVSLTRAKSDVERSNWGRLKGP
jgi:hypothetical protein